MQPFDFGGDLTDAALAGLSNQTIGTQLALTLQITACEENTP
jgi:hypothetical protein